MNALILWYTRWMNEERHARLQSLGLLVLRLGVGGMMLSAHGWGKLTTYSEKAAAFADPLGLGPSVTMALAVGAEFFCALAVMLGLMTRLAVIPLMSTMLVAATIVHAADPWAKKEFALLYFLPFLTLLFTGAGRYSLDALLSRRVRTEETD